MGSRIPEIDWNEDWFSIFVNLEGAMRPHEIVYYHGYWHGRNGYQFCQPYSAKPNPENFSLGYLDGKGDRDGWSS